jgi:hypothetical protein
VFLAVLFFGVALSCMVYFYKRKKFDVSTEWTQPQSILFNKEKRPYYISLSCVSFFLLSVAVSSKFLEDILEYGDIFHNVDKDDRTWFLSLVSVFLLLILSFIGQWQLSTWGLLLFGLAGFAGSIILFLDEPTVAIVFTLFWLFHAFVYTFLRSKSIKGLA